MSTWASRQHSSLHQHCQILHSSWVLKTPSPIDALRKTRTHPQQPATASTRHPSNGKETWWALQIKSRSCSSKNAATQSGPKVKDTPLSLSPHPLTSLSGSAHSRSQSNPESGTSAGLGICFICSSDFKSGDSPPCMHKIFSSINAATGKQLKQSVNVLHNRTLYRLLHSSKKP